MGAIDSLELYHFKAFEDDVKFKFEGKNSLVFGENGSGKTSFYEALKLAFFNDKLESSKISSFDTPEDANAKRNQMYESFRNANDTSMRFTIKINGDDYTVLARNDYRVFLVTHADFELHDDCILLEETLGRLFFDFNVETPKGLLQMICDDLEYAVNTTLENQFSETVRVSIDRGEGFRCILSDLDGHLAYGTNISHYFNEGKIHLILIIIYINAFLLMTDSQKNNILVLDDIITSLDATNRAFVLRFLFDSVKRQESLQMFLLTHNVSFYNLTKHYINNYLTQEEQNNWTFYTLYNLGNQHKLYPQDEDTIEKVETDFQSGNTPIETLGNRIRQLFEIDVQELAKIIITGGLEESKNILVRLANGNPIYYKDGKDVFELVKILEGKAKIIAFTSEQLSKELLDTIEDFKNDPDLANIRELLRHMTLFQKISLHPTSHGVLGLTPVSTKEIKESIQLVKKLEGCLGSLRDKNVINM